MNEPQKRQPKYAIIQTAFTVAALAHPEMGHAKPSGSFRAVTVSVVFCILWRLTMMGT